MATVSKILCHWTGAGVTGPSITTFVVDAGSEGTAVPAIREFFDQIKSRLPADVSVQVDNVGDSYNSADAAYVSSWSTTTAAAVAGTYGGNYAQGVGCRIKWLTNGRRNNRRVQGSTFIVPLSGDSFSTNGTLNSDAATAIGPKAYDLWNTLGGDMLIWSRPKGSEIGFVNSVVGVELSMQTSWLRSRRT